MAARALRYDTVFSFKGPAGLYAYGVEYDQTSDTILVSDYWNYRVKRFNKDTGALLKTFGQGIGAPYDVEVDQAGNVWVAYQEQSVVAEYTQGGTLHPQDRAGRHAQLRRGLRRRQDDDPHAHPRSPRRRPLDLGSALPQRLRATTRPPATSSSRSIPAARTSATDVRAARPRRDAAGQRLPGRPVEPARSSSQPRQRQPLIRCSRPRPTCSIRVASTSTRRAA